MTIYTTTAYRLEDDNLGGEIEHEVVITFDYIPGQKETRDHPGFPSDVVFISADQFPEWAEDWFNASKDVVLQEMEDVLPF